MTPWTSFFSSNKRIISKWQETSTPEDIQLSLATLFSKGNPNQGNYPQITPAELQLLSTNLSKANSSPFLPILKSYAAYPFPATENSVLDSDGFIRAICLLTNRTKSLDHRQTMTGVNVERIVTRGRDVDVKNELLFRLQAKESPTVEDVLDILAVVQPRPNACMSPLDREALRPMAERLVGEREEVGVEGLKVRREDLKSLGVAGYGDGEITWVEFKGLNVLEALRVRMENEFLI